MPWKHSKNRGKPRKSRQLRGFPKDSFLMKENLSLMKSDRGEGRADQARPPSFLVLFNFLTAAPINAPLTDPQKSHPPFTISISFRFSVIVLFIFIILSFCPMGFVSFLLWELFAPCACIYGKDGLVGSFFSKEQPVSQFFSGNAGKAEIPDSRGHASGAIHAPQNTAF